MTEIVKPSILPGFMELTPQDQILFNKLMDTIRKNFEKFGFLPLDTPVLEKSEILLAKGGGETEKQIYRFSKGDTDMSMRFDLTVPLARYVAMRYSDLSFPFRRYQIGKVYRGERNQKGRYREFYQCDIDVIGNETLDIINDAEIPSIIYSTFKDLDFGKFTIRLNNRKILNGFFKSVGVTDPQDVLRIVDKLEKIGEEKVMEELKGISLSDEAIDSILKFISIDGTNDEKIEKLKAMNVDNELFSIGVDEMEKIMGYMRSFGMDEDYFEFDLTIARGLDYYTGTVYETKLDYYPQLGSVCSGGRYEDLAGYYINQSLPGVGISIGLTRLFYQLRDAGIISDHENSLSKVIIIPFDEYMEDGIKLVTELRDAGIYSLVYTEPGKLSKKMKYANALNIPYTIVVGESEVKEGIYSLKDMRTGEQREGTLAELITCLK